MGGDSLLAVKCIYIYSFLEAVVVVVVVVVVGCIMRRADVR